MGRHSYTVRSKEKDYSHYTAWLDARALAGRKIDMKHKRRGGGVHMHTHHMVRLVRDVDQAVKTAEAMRNKDGKYPAEVHNTLEKTLKKLVNEYVNEAHLGQTYCSAVKDTVTSYLLAKSANCSIWAMVLPPYTYTHTHTRETLGVIGMYHGQVTVQNYELDVATKTMTPNGDYPLEAGDTKILRPDEPLVAKERDWISYHNLDTLKKAVMVHVYTSDMTTKYRRSYRLDTTTNPPTPVITHYRTNRYANLERVRGIIDLETDKYAVDYDELLAEEARTKQKLEEKKSAEVVEITDSSSSSSRSGSESTSSLEVESDND